MIETIFAIPMTNYIFKNKKLNDKLIKFTMDMKKTVKGNIISNEGGWQSPSVDLSTPFKVLVLLVEVAVKSVKLPENVAST